jgi:GNAT superfamily N-acetyltransferase
MSTEVTRTYLQMGRPDELRAAPAPSPAARVERMAACPPSFFRYLYREVGKNYHWVDRLAWSDEQVAARLHDPDVTLHLLTFEGSPAGYFELERHDDDSVEVAYFGLLPEFLGRGLGKYLLSEAVREAWGLRPRRVWLHTCTLDDPAALPNYVGRGFRPYQTEVYTVE